MPSVNIYTFFSNENKGILMQTIVKIIIFIVN